MDFEGVYTQEDNPNQVRAFNYVLSYDVIDTETGQLIVNNEFRTVASGETLSLDVIKERSTGLIETEQT